MIRRGTALWALFVVVSSLVAAEAIGRLALEDPIADPHLVGMVDPSSDSRRMTPSKSYTSTAGVRIHINEFGFRTRTADARIPAPSDARIRIAVLGDSETFCEALPYDHCLPGQLEKSLRARYPTADFEVLSFGIPGTNTRDHLRWLREIVLPLQPDVVLLNYVLNDIELFDRTTIIDLRHWYDRSFLVRYVRYQRFLTHTAELRREKARVYRRWVETRSHAIWSDYFASLYGDPELWNAMRATLRSLRDESEAAGAAFIMTALAALAEVSDFRFDYYPYRESLAKLRTLGDDGIRFVDMLPAYVEADRPALDYAVTLADLHHNERGNRLLVDYLIERPEFRGLIEPLVAAPSGAGS